MTEVHEWTVYMEEFLGNLTDSFRSDWGLDAESCPDWCREQSEEAWRLAKHVDQATPLLFRYAVTLDGHVRAQLTAEVAKLERETVVLSWNPSRIDEEMPGLYEPHKINARELLLYGFTVRMAEEEAPLFPAMADRAIDLLQFVSRTRSEKTRGYLSRVSECYRRGMATEGVIMCRSVLETALDAYLDLDDVAQKGYAPNTRYVSLCAKLDYLRDESDVSHEVWKAADFVRRIGNQAAHKNPGIEGFKAVLKNLTVVLDALAEDCLEST